MGPTDAVAEATLVTLNDIEAAADRIGDLVLRTPLVQLPHPQSPDRILHCKAECLQPTGAFKLRGAYNTIAQVLDQARANGIVAQSSGNHARAVAWLARRLSLRAVIVMPDAAPPTKIDAVRELGADVEVVPSALRDVRAHELAAEHGYVHVPPYDDPRIIAGQGTVGLEIVQQLPEVSTVLVPISGGGLISGIATAVKALKPETRVIGVEPELAADAAQSLREGRRISWDPQLTYRTVADGLRTPAIGVHPWAHVQRYVDDIVTVTEDQILAAMRHLALAGRLVAEPSGAVAAAAWLHNIAGAENDGGAVAAVVSGGSVDPALLAAVLQPAS
ncbi:pyridoxal-phosphate dependent enzyme [Arthrobacter sp. JZ12]|uniref:threonine ammonia-lyase n=1 Tax=Arthrobacter sp. JZ12 TaxID=2654190 RepID=UPI002B4A8CCC|nr:threonine/serine dehydratase [Arthrobacter sp. JZ12]WRH24255.1 pyridoxal-phosphate dependent enzyme [Arthrobacter sp. JZ12]